jgi:hypothetical protein
MYDESDNTWELDYDTTDVVFSDGVAFHADSGEWFILDELMEADYIDYGQMLQEKLGK